MLVTDTVLEMKTNEMPPTLAGIFEDLEKMAIEKGLKKGSQDAKSSIARNLLYKEFSDEKL